MTRIFEQFDIPNFYHGFKRHHLCLVAKTDNSEIMGGVVFTIKEYHAFVISIAVKKEYQRNRIGTSLMKVVEDVVIFKNRHRIEVITPKDERKYFYLFLGFKEYRGNHMDKWLGFFKKSFLFLKKTLNFKMAPTGIPYSS